MVGMSKNWVMQWNSVRKDPFQWAKASKKIPKSKVKECTVAPEVDSVCLENFKGSVHKVQEVSSNLNSLIVKQK